MTLILTSQLDRSCRCAETALHESSNRPLAWQDCVALKKIVKNFTTLFRLANPQLSQPV